jgi:Glyoxalase/Bleomycin resistance protein/Dioxygenase superfamily
VAAGAYGRPRIPAFAPELDSGILQLHSSDYRNPSQLREGGVLVVGAANSGAETALEASRDRRTWLSGRHPGQEPYRPGSSRWGDRLLIPVIWFMASHVLTVKTPMGRAVQQRFHVGGGRHSLGLVFQYALASSLVGGVGRDAKHIAEHIASREPNGRPGDDVLAGARRSEVPDPTRTGEADRDHGVSRATARRASTQRCAGRGLPDARCAGRAWRHRDRHRAGDRGRCYDQRTATPFSLVLKPAPDRGQQNHQEGDPMTQLPAVSHVALTVTDLATSLPWYERLLGTKPVLDEDTGGFHHTVYLLPGGTLLALHQHPATNGGDPLRRAAARPGPPVVRSPTGPS